MLCKFRFLAQAWLLMAPLALPGWSSESVTGKVDTSGFAPFYRQPIAAAGSRVVAELSGVENATEYRMTTEEGCLKADWTPLTVSSVPVTAQAAEVNWHYFQFRNALGTTPCLAHAFSTVKPSYSFDFTKP